VKKLKTTNPELIKLIQDLKKKSRENETEIWLDTAKHLSTSKRKRIAVNVSRLNRYTTSRETIVVPGKVLGAGKISHPMTVGAFAFSDLAKSKILKANGDCLFIRDLMEKNPTGKNVKLMR
jgi:large subunit ribosomal protein L18e